MEIICCSFDKPRLSSPGAGRILRPVQKPLIVRDIGVRASTEVLILRGVGWVVLEIWKRNLDLVYVAFRIDVRQSGKENTPENAKSCR